MKLICHLFVSPFISAKKLQYLQTENGRVNPSCASFETDRWDRWWRRSESTQVYETSKDRTCRVAKLHWAEPAYLGQAWILFGSKRCRTSGGRRVWNYPAVFTDEWSRKGLFIKIHPSGVRSGNESCRSSERKVSEQRGQHRVRVRFHIFQIHSYLSGTLVSSGLVHLLTRVASECNSIIPHL